MKFFNLKKDSIKLCSMKTMNIVQSLELYRGRTFALPKKMKINRLHSISKRKSVTSSNSIEGITVSASREKAILVDNKRPQNKEEEMIVGYNKALERVFEVYQYQSLDESFILDLHYLMYESFNPSFGGRYKVEQNYIREYDSKGNLKRTVFIPAKPKDVSQLMGNLIYQFNECAKDPNVNILILIPMFILDFLCIHPFFDGNGRLSRLLTTFLLLKYGYEVDKYYATSYAILKQVDEYYDALEMSSKNWHENKNNYEAFVTFILNVVHKSYQKVDYIFKINDMNLNADEKVLKVINDAQQKINKAEIEEILVNLSRTTIEAALVKLVKEKKIKLLQSGRYAYYYRK